MRDVQDFAREITRVEGHGNPVGLVDADGIQRGEVASHVRSSGTSSEDLAEQLGFSSTQDMAAAQNTDFIDDKYQEELARRAIEEALNERYGSASPDVQAMLANGDFVIRQANFASSVPAIEAVKQAADKMPEIPQKVWEQTYEVIQEIAPTPEENDVLKRLSRRRRRLVNERTRVVANAMQADLQAVCPGLLEVIWDVNNLWFLTFLTCRQGLAKLDRVRGTSLLKMPSIGRRYTDVIRPAKRKLSSAKTSIWSVR